MQREVSVVYFVVISIFAQKTDRRNKMRRHISSNLTEILNMFLQNTVLVHFY